MIIITIIMVRIMINKMRNLHLDYMKARVKNGYRNSRPANQMAF